MGWTVDIGVPCNKNESSKWWGKLMAEALRATEQGVRVRKTIFAGGALTDSARNTIAATFLQGGSDWLFMFDDDTIPPPGTMVRLLELNVPLASGVYFGRVDVKAGEPVVPLFYRREHQGVAAGEYFPISDYYRGEIVTADAAGLGCSLIHRDVFTAIMDHYVLMKRPTGPILPVDPSRVDAHLSLGLTLFDPLTAEREYHYPFFAFDNGRTEDFFFFELAHPLGYRVVVDTRVECQHLTDYVIDGVDYWGQQARQLGEPLCDTYAAA